MAKCEGCVKLTPEQERELWMTQTNLSGRPYEPAKRNADGSVTIIGSGGQKITVKT